MTANRLLLHTFFLFLLPIVVAWAGLSVAAAIALVLLALLWRWAISLSVFIAPPKLPELELESISASHFVEKVRWCMDRLGLDYVERPVGGTLGAFFLGRTVPVLHFRSGAVRSRIGNSPEILRYLWGRYAAEAGERAAFLEPTPERLEFEQAIDRCGTDLQVWVYHHILDHRKLTLHAWGAESPEIPAWQRLALKTCYPVLRLLIRKSFRITPKHHTKSVQHIEALLADVERKLADGRRSILGGDELNYTDFAFAAIMGLWLQPSGFGGGRAETVRIDPSQYPAEMQAETATWSGKYPRATAFITDTYADERSA